MLKISDADIGGARVRRLFQGGQYRAGQMLSAEEVLSFRNRQTLAEQGYIELFPKATATADMERHVVSRGAGKYDVIAGVKLNDQLLTKDEAEELARPKI
jgi:hypothetical protein